MNREPTAGAVALFRLGPYFLGLAVSEIASVEKGPFQITPLPLAASHVKGIARLGRATVPVFDLSSYLSEGPAPTALGQSPYIITLRVQGSLLGITIDEILTVHAATEGTLSPLSTLSGADNPVFKTLFIAKAGGPPAIVVDGESLLRLPFLCGVPIPAPAIEAARTGSEGRILLFEAGDGRFALPLGSTLAVTQAPDRLDSVLDHNVLRGFHRIHLSDTPVLSLTALLGLPEGTNHPRLHILAKGFGRVAAWEASRAVAIRSLRDLTVTKAEGLTPDLQRVVCGQIQDTDGTPVLLLDPEQLHQSPEVVERPLSRGQSTDSTILQGGASGELRQYMIFRAGGGTLAADLRQLRQVISLDSITEAGDGAGPLLGFASVSEISVAILDLGVLLGRPGRAAKPGRPVILCPTPKGQIGFAVDSFEVICRGRTRANAISHQLRHGRAPAFRDHLHTQVAGQSVTASVLDFDALVREGLGDENVVSQ